MLANSCLEEDRKTRLCLVDAAYVLALEPGGFAESFWGKGRVTYWNIVTLHVLQKKRKLMLVTAGFFLDVRIMVNFQFLKHAFQ